MELMPRSDRARLIDFVKFNGAVDGSRKSKIGFHQKLACSYLVFDDGELSTP